MNQSIPIHAIYDNPFHSRTAPATASTRLAEVYAELEAIESDKAPSRASVILAGLGFTPAMQVIMNILESSFGTREPRKKCISC